MSKSKRRDDIYNPHSPRYDRVKHSRKLLYEAKDKLQKGEITEAQFKLLVKESELVVTGQWQHKHSSFAPTINKAQFAQEVDADSKRSVLSTNLSKVQLPLAERERLANKKATAILAVQLFRQDYPDSSVSLKACDKAVQLQYLRRAKYQLTSTRGTSQVTAHNPNAVKPLKLKKTFSEKVPVTVSSTLTLESKSKDTAPKPKKSRKPKVTTHSVKSEAEKLYKTENPTGNFEALSDSDKTAYYRKVVNPHKPTTTNSNHAEIAGCTVDLSSLDDSVLPQAVEAEATRLLKADYPRRTLDKQKLAVKLNYISRAIEVLQG